jgi:hypothetical protein
MKTRHTVIEESEFRYKSDIVGGNVNRFLAKIDIVGNDVKTLDKAIHTLMRVKCQMEDED